MPGKNLPIGVIDSGIGGLTVLKEIIKSLPNENLIYLGDTARVPYGTREKETIKKFADELVMFMLNAGCKAIVVACNTMSAVALPDIKRLAGKIPVIDVIEPTVRLSVKENQGNGTAVIGTRATINSRAYEARIYDLNKSIEVTSIACPMFVPLIEEGFAGNPSAEIIAKTYLDGLKDKKIDNLILGCTHYPLLKKVIRKVINNDTDIIDSAKPTSLALNKVLVERKLLNPTPNRTIKLFVTDIHPRMEEMIVDIFGDNKLKLQKVNLV
jgi:glutamate racemase